MRTLVVTTVLPSARAGGGEVCTGNFLSALEAAGCDLTVLGHGRPGDAAAGAGRGHHKACDLPIETGEAGARKYLWLAESLLSGQPYTCRKFRSTAMRRAIKRFLAERRYDLLVVDHSQMGWILGLGELPEKKVFIAHNREAALYAAMATRQASPSLRAWLYRREASRIAAVERRLVRGCDQTWTVSDGDAAAFRRIGPPDRVHCFAVPGARLSVQDGQACRGAERFDAVLLGSWTWEANRIGLAWFLEQVVPLLPPSFRIGVAGAGAIADTAAPANVTFKGYVEDAGAFLRSARVVALPTMVGAGVSLGAVAAVASGTPVVATGTALRALGTLPSRVARTDAEPAAFAAALLEAASGQAAGDPVSGCSWYAARRRRFDAAVGTALGRLA